ncbi:Hypothetical protein PP7435_CHR1-1569 [Komagataella phaffii CBS 7435]|uniref:Fe2OG dioxygenase domain-containing protein n=2 Tax=Komagataella phaffii TaxID=460519 RepID=C4R9E4_KOMPG|nr:GQ67_01372T0 [Komagataella phaffii]AOA65992.1 GQ68_01388T0 [Komagataella phaffii GS115]CAH2447451.1 Hypothetical protein BQ9382_C1-8195 [Komagataella phaffii CBS 7435]CAY67039.1 hypothetical protein with 2OG-Fe(II) oxygenase domain [Komagataella pastoris]CCA37680.1 Hypothetical protein PP7435_CHR1-1569 [Komagataella phaffii CBS 7435]
MANKDLFEKEVKERVPLQEFKEPNPLPEEIAAQYPTIDLVSLDLSQYEEGNSGLEKRKALAKQLENALSTSGFFHLSNVGLAPEVFNRVRSIGQLLMSIPDEEKVQYLAGALTSDEEDRSKSLGGERGSGFKPKKYWSNNNVRDSIEHYNFRDFLHDDIFLSDEGVLKHPKIVRGYLRDISDYFNYLHYEIVRKICNLSDIILEIPEGTLWDNYMRVIDNDPFHSGGGFGRLMRYYNPSPEDEVKTNQSWLRGHSDGSFITVLTSNPILSLQIRDYETGEWKFVSHKPDSLVVNVGDGFEFLSGGYFKSSIHRVHSPVEEQKGETRFQIIYFVDPDRSLVIDPETINSPKLNRLGYHKPKEWEKITFDQWNDNKGRLFGKNAVNNVKGDEPVVVKLFGRLHERWHQVDNAQPPAIAEHERLYGPPTSINV